MYKPHNSSNTKRTLRKTVIATRSTTYPVAMNDNVPNGPFGTNSTNNSNVVNLTAVFTDHFAL